MEDKSSLLRQLRIDRTIVPVRRSVPIWLWAAGGLLLVLVLAAGAWALFSQSAGVPVRVAVAREAAGGGGGSLLDASGYVVARRQATVSAKIAGKMAEVLIEEGDRVQKDQVIGRLDDTNAQAALAQARANVAAARTDLADARPLFERDRNQWKRGLISGAAFDAAKAGFDAKQTTLAVAEAALLVATRNLQDTEVRAPFGGVVTAKAAQPGEIVSPLSSGGFTRTGIATIVDMDSLEVQVDVSENFINRVRPGQPATIKLNAYPDWDIPAAVIAIIPTADQSKATVKVRVAFKQPVRVGAHLTDGRVLPEMGARVSFFEEGAAKATAAGIVLPAEAVQGEGQTGTVYVISGDRVERRVVRLGARGAEGQVVLSGLTAGTRVAVGDLSHLQDGVRIRIED